MSDAYPRELDSDLRGILPEDIGLMPGEDDQECVRRCLSTACEILERCTASTVEIIETRRLIGKAMRLLGLDYP
jgi:hypothetical protein